MYYEQNEKRSTSLPKIKTFKTLQKLSMAALKITLEIIIIVLLSVLDNFLSDVGGGCNSVENRRGVFESLF